MPFLVKMDKWLKKFLLKCRLFTRPLYTVVKKWSNLFKQDKESIKDDPVPERPTELVTKQNKHYLKMNYIRA